MAPRQKLQIVQEILQIRSAQSCPSRHLRVQRISPCIDAGHDGGLHGLPIEGRMPATSIGVHMAIRVGEMIQSDVGSRNAVHHAPAAVVAMTHGTSDTFHAVAVFHGSSSGRDAIEKNPAPIIGMGYRTESGAQAENKCHDAEG